MKLVLQFMHPSPLVTCKSATYRPTSFPPEPDWPVTVDNKGVALSFYGDNYWDFNAFGFHGFEFGKFSLSSENRELFKRVMLFIMYHPKLFPGTIKSCNAYFQTLKKITVFCDTNGILIRDLYKYPRLYPMIVKEIQCARIHDRVSQLHKLKLYSEELGFVVADDKLLQLITREAKQHESTQHPYIPPRIWCYQVQRLNDALDDFIEHKDAIYKAFTWLHDAYQYNREICPVIYQSPFNERHLYKKRIIYNGNFNDFLSEFGLIDLFQRWMEPTRDIHGSFSTLTFSKYLSLIRDIAIIFILNFSMQRKSEATSLKSDCFYIEKDSHLGDICLLRGETTKTDPDSDARWVVPKTVMKAVNLATWIAKLRLSSLPSNYNFPQDTKNNPYLLTAACELWSSGGGAAKNQAGYRKLLNNRRTLDYINLIRRGSKLFDAQELVVNKEDYNIAIAMTPNLHNKEWFGVGKQWKFTTHQVRRTLAVNMFASDDVSISSIQHQMKHLSRQMTLYYGRNYTNLRLDSKVEKTLILESYRSIYKKLIEVVEDEVENVRPHKTNLGVVPIVELINENEEKTLLKLIKSGQVGCRRTLLGFCMKSGACEYGGIESISKCAGGDGKGVCADAIFVRKNREKLIKLKASHENELNRLTQDSMRFGSLKQEIYAIEVYLNVIDK
ncbi:hypothetical protein [Pseudoalteromonas piscicida]|uniref:hypothetical protein n=1 Tax=Pseudoalteromonas piscicida TaxID=43662 RepID=UPI0027E5B068|nr:hypothetical protein [Pseudoalteromonas piscicida]WMO14909.1 hypothetical protein NI376_04640 [Pseudoalteromonas piscicida]